MKKLFLVLIICLSLISINCEYEDIHNFYLVYSITSLDSNPVDIDVTYKVGEEYITEQTQTPFIVEQDIELNKVKNENFYYYLEVLSTDKNNVNIQVISNDKELHNFNNLLNPIFCSGFIGFGLTSVNIML